MRIHLSLSPLPSPSGTGTNLLEGHGVHFVGLEVCVAGFCDLPASLAQPRLSQPVPRPLSLVAWLVWALVSLPAT